MKSSATRWSLLCVLSVLSGTPALAAAFDYDASMDMNAPAESSDRDTFLRFMETKVKPAMDRLATDGYQMCSAADVAAAYAAAHAKVRRKVDNNFGGITKVKTIVNKLNIRLDGRKVTLATLPSEIRAVAPTASVYDLANFLGLACGGGVKTVFFEDNFALNVHYDVTEQRSGRSYGVTSDRAANDASDKDYLDDLEEYSRGETEDLSDFYTALFGALLNTDGSGIAAVEADGKAVLTDFLAVYTAEQARNLMDGSITPHWDAALLEVTLIAGFHAGQSDMKLYYRNPADDSVSFTDQTLRQKACTVPTSTQQASLSDYWQFSRNIDDPQNCKRSGINITNGEFRKLGRAITAHMRANHRSTYDRVKNSMGLTGSPTNLYNSLSKYLIAGNAPRTMTAAKVATISAAWLEFLEIVTAEADEISATLE